MNGGGKAAKAAVEGQWKAVKGGGKAVKTAVKGSERPREGSEWWR